MAECVCLENRFTSDGNVGSNPTSSVPLKAIPHGFLNTIQPNLQFDCNLGDNPKISLAVVRKTHQYFLHPLFLIFILKTVDFHKLPKGDAGNTLEFFIFSLKAFILTHILHNNS